MLHKKVNLESYLDDTRVDHKDLSIAARIEIYENALLENNAHEYLKEDLMAGLTIAEKDNLLESFYLSEILINEGFRRNNSTAFTK